MIKAIIIDDEPDAVVTLTTMLHDFCEGVLVVASTNNPTEGITLIQDHAPDLVFLDIQMPHMDGFTLLDNLDHQHFKLVFVTAHENFALKAIKHSALDYILKPINPNELQQTIAKVQATSEQHTQIAWPALRESLKEEKLEKMVVHTEREAFVITISELIRCEADSNYTKFHLANQSQIFASKPLKFYESMLLTHNFVRTHRSHLINLAFVKKIRTAGIKKYRVELNTGKQIPISTSRYSAVRALILT
jgi:two-component system LytT family response regulator